MQNIDLDVLNVEQNFVNNVKKNHIILEETVVIKNYKSVDFAKNLF